MPLWIVNNSRITATVSTSGMALRSTNSYNSFLKSVTARTMVSGTNPAKNIFSNGHGKQCACSSCKAGGKAINERDLSSVANPTSNRGVIFMGPNHVEVKGIPFPTLELDSTSSPVVSERQKRSCPHGAILKVVTTNICGSDQHMVRGRTRFANRASLLAVVDEL